MENFQSGQDPSGATLPPACDASASQSCSANHLCWVRFWNPPDFIGNRSTGSFFKRFLIKSRHFELTLGSDLTTNIKPNWKLVPQVKAQFVTSQIMITRDNNGDFWPQNLIVTSFNLLYLPFGNVAAQWRKTLFRESLAWKSISSETFDVFSKLLWVTGRGRIPWDMLTWHSCAGKDATSISTLSSIWIRPKNACKCEVISW